MYSYRQLILLTRLVTHSLSCAFQAKIVVASQHEDILGQLTALPTALAVHAR